MREVRVLFLIRTNGMLTLNETSHNYLTPYSKKYWLLRPAIGLGRFVSSLLGELC